MMAWIRHRVYGHYWHGDEVARAYQRQPDGTMVESGMIVHMRCLRCGDTKKKRVRAHPASEASDRSAP